MRPRSEANDAGSLPAGPSPFRQRLLLVEGREGGLEALERAFAARARRWIVERVGTGEAALEVLRRDAVDALVAAPDTRAGDRPLFAAAAEAQSRALRLALADADADVPDADRVLPRRAEADDVEETVERALALRGVLEDGGVRSSLADVDELPTTSRVYDDLVAALQDPAVRIDQVCEIVLRDQAVCARILQVVNSSFLGLARKIANVREAINYLGFDRVKSVVLSSNLVRGLEGVELPAGFSPEEEQAHALATGTIARELVVAGDAEDAFTAGLLHDVGRTLLAVHLRPLHERVARASHQLQRPSFQVEPALLGFGHAELGAHLLAGWGLPPAIVEAVAFHHRPSLLPSRAFDLVGAVHVADALARAARAEDRAALRGALARLDLDYLRRHDLVERVPEWKDLARRAVDEAA